MATTGASVEAQLQYERSLIDRWIVPHPSKSGYAESVVADNWTSVWTIFNLWLANNGDGPSVMDAYNLPEDALKAALAYYRQHKHLIDARIALEDDMWSDER